jgi:Ca2+-binding EF-hand superfamily protein
MGQNLAATKPIYENLESELEFINKQTGLPKKDLEELYQSFSAKSEKGQITKKEFLAGYKTFYPQ